MKHLEDDHIGFQTLDNISDAEHLNGWIYSTIRPYCSGDILEVGSGIGNISRFLLEGPFRVTLSDFRESYCKRLGEVYRDRPGLSAIVTMDLVDPNFDTRFSGFMESFDTIIALNVIEHIRDDYTAVKNLSNMLKKGGLLIILVPAFEFLYNRFDRNLGHYRRYRTSQLRNLMEGQGLGIRHSNFFNALGMPGWFVSGVLLGNKSIPKNHVWLFNKMVFLSKVLDKILFRKIGLSIICIGEKA